MKSIIITIAKDVERELAAQRKLFTNHFVISNNHGINKRTIRVSFEHLLLSEKNLQK